MTQSRRSTSLLGAGALLLAVALLVPGAAWVELLRGAAAADRTPLLRGALVFRALLLALSAYLLWAWWMRWPGPRSTTAAPRWPSGRDAWILAGLLSAALAIRLVRLGDDLWLDEVVTMVRYAGLSVGEILSTYDLQNQHFLYSVLAHLSIEAFGPSEWALRLPAVVFGVLGVGAVAWLGIEISDRTDALWAAALLAVSPQHVWFSQNARAYTAVFFFSVLATLLFLRALRSGSIRTWWAFAACTALGVFAHQSMLFVTAGHVTAWAWWSWRARDPEVIGSRWRPFGAGFVPAGLATLALHAFALPQILARTTDEVSPVVVWRSPLWMIRETLSGLTGAAGTLPLVLAGALGAVIIVTGLVILGRRRHLVPIVALVPPVLGATVVIAFQHHLWPRFFFFALGLFLLIAVRGVRGISAAAARVVGRRGPAEARWAERSALSLVLVASLWLLPSRFGPKQDYTGARDWVQERVQDGDRVVSVGMAGFVYANWYAPSWPDVADVETLESVRREARTTWVLYTLAPELQASLPAVKRRLDTEFEPVATFGGTLSGGEIYVVRAPGPRGS